LRVGLHSGPVTAGVLMGEKSRFQLFGDTVNTASRMESTGERDKIQASQSTANLLIEAGKGAWIVPRSEKVKAKVRITPRRKRLGYEYARDTVLIVTHFLLLYPYFSGERRAADVLDRVSRSKPDSKTSRTMQ
jgi:hypothetical protein